MFRKFLFATSLVLTAINTPAGEYDLAHTFDMSLGFDYFGFLSFNGKKATSADIARDSGMAFSLGYNLNPSYESYQLE